MREKNTYNVIFGTAGIVLMLPALLLISGGILFSIFRSPQIEKLLNPDLFIFYPVIIVGGLVVSAVINIGFMLQQKKLARLNLSVAILSVILLGAIFLYLMAENTEVFSLIS